MELLKKEKVEENRNRIAHDIGIGRVEQQVYALGQGDGALMTSKIIIFGKGQPDIARLPGSAQMTNYYLTLTLETLLKLQIPWHRKRGK